MHAMRLTFERLLSGSFPRLLLLASALSAVVVLSCQGGTPTARLLPTIAEIPTEVGSASPSPTSSAIVTESPTHSPTVTPTQTQEATPTETPSPYTDSRADSFSRAHYCAGG